MFEKSKIFSNRAAQVHTDGMVVCGKMTHGGCNRYRPDKPGLLQRVQDQNYQGIRMVKENVARWYRTAQSVFNGWKKSPGHNAAMLDPNMQHIGMSVLYIWFNQ